MKVSVSFVGRKLSQVPHLPARATLASHHLEQQRSRLGRAYLEVAGMFNTWLQNCSDIPLLRALNRVGQALICL